MDGIHQTVAMLEKSILFDVDLAFEKRWRPDEFLDEFRKNIQEKKKNILSMLKSVDNSVQVRVCL